MQENVNKVGSCARFFSMRAFAHNRRSGLRGLISKFMKSQTWKQIITVQILSNISRSKHSQAMKFGQLIKYNVRNNFFLKNHTGNEARRLVLDLFFFFEKALYNVKESGRHYDFNIFWQTSIWHTKERYCIKFKTVNPEILLFFLPIILGRS